MRVGLNLVFKKQSKEEGVVEEMPEVDKANPKPTEGTVNFMNPWSN